MNNIEWKESSLTAPTDRISTPQKPWRPSTAPPLSDSEVDKAIEEINITDYIGLKFPRVDRVYADPAIINQVYSLFSFVPSKNAKPDEKGVYGYGKIRGCFATDIESNQRAEYLVKNVDSYHPIYHGFVGRPFPITSSSKYSAEVKEIDIKKQMTDTISADVKAKKEEEKKEIQDMKDREEALLNQSKSIQEGTYEEDPFENYITLKVKKAQLTWTYVEHMNKMKEIEHILAKTRKELEDLDELDPTYKDKYFDKYKSARKKSGLDEKIQQDNFIKYMVEDLPIPNVDALYEELKKGTLKGAPLQPHLEDVVSDVVEDVSKVVSDVVENVSEVVSDVVEDVSKVVSDVVDVVSEVVSDVVEDVSDVVEVVSDVVEEVVSDVVEEVDSDVVSDVVEEVVSEVRYKHCKWTEDITKEVIKEVIKNDIEVVSDVVEEEEDEILI
jgi:hypothetical protein